MPNIVMGGPQSPTFFSRGAKIDYKYPRGMDLDPNSVLHRKIITEVWMHCNDSSMQMSRRYPYWKKVDQTLTAYIRPDDIEKALKASDERKPISIVVPYSYRRIGRCEVSCLRRVDDYYIFKPIPHLNKLIALFIVVIGTLLHEDSLLAKLIADPEWHTIEIDLCSDDLKSNWPNFMTDDEVKALYESYKNKGQLDVFAREYRGVPIATETASFRQSYFKNYDEQSDEFIKVRNRLENVVIIDPAKTTNFTSADSAIVGVGVDTQKSSIYVRDIQAGKFHPDEIYDIAFAMADRIGARTIGYEVTSLNEFITYPFTTEMIKRRKFYQLIELKARASKEERIAMLVPFYRMGYIYHNPAISPILEQQLLAYPRSKRWDVMDAFAYIIEMLELGERYFSSEDKEDDPQAIEDEYKELENEDEPVAQGWRPC